MPVRSTPRLHIRRITMGFDEKWKLDPSSGCWEWIASKNSHGYGAIQIKKGLTRGAHRTAYELFKGVIPPGLHVCHRCDNRKCVNPAHLFLGTNADNMKDRHEKDGYAQGEKHANALLTQDQVKLIYSCMQNAPTGAGRSIAKFFGVSEHTISKIKHKKLWRHLWVS